MVGGSKYYNTQRDAPRGYSIIGPLCNGGCITIPLIYKGNIYLTLYVPVFLVYFRKDYNN